MLSTTLNMYTGRQRCLSNCSVNILKTVVRSCSRFTLSEADKVAYPPIRDLSRRAKIRREKDVWHGKVRKLESVEEKLFGINMPHYYGWRSLFLQEGDVMYNSLDHTQYITRTHVFNDGNLPQYYNSLSTPEQIDKVVEIIKPHVEKVVAFEHCHRLRRQETEETVEEVREKSLKNDLIKSLIYQINRILLATLSWDMPHLLEAQVDYDPRVEAFWFVGGVEPPTRVRRTKEKCERIKEYANDPVDVPVQYVGSPILQLRHEFPLREILPLEDSVNSELTVPVFKFDPRVLGHSFTLRHASSIPGFWPGDSNEFGLLSYHNTNDLFHSSTALTEDAITVQAILASYGWLLSQACYQGFSTVNDITYPLVTQTVLTNGQLWSFCVYQLNTTLLHSEHAEENPKRNLCWITEPMKLFDKVEDGIVHGFNPDVIKKLLLLYGNTPARRTNVDMQPYLGESVKRVADIEDPERRAWLEMRFKHLMSNRPRHYKVPEIANWQWIYMINHRTRPMEKRRDPWQFGYNPYKRRMDDHLPVYVPRALRENPRKRKIGRWAKSYYPDA